jgi:hypothetical protein
MPLTRGDVSSGTEPGLGRVQSRYMRYRGIHVLDDRIRQHDRVASEDVAPRLASSNPEVPGDGHVAGALDDIPKAVVVALLRARVVGMETIIGRSLTPLNSSGTLVGRPSA